MPVLRPGADGHRRRARPDHPGLPAVRLVVHVDRRPRNRGGRMTTTSTRAGRMAMPIARDSIRKIAESVGGCLRPIQLRRTDTATGQTEQIMKPCGATLASICPPCAERAKALRVIQCREGWHLEDEPDPGPAAPDQTQEYWLTLRAEAQVQRDHAEARGEDVTA